MFTQISEGTTASVEQRNSAKVQQIFTQYGAWALELSAGDALKAADHMKSARDAVSAAQAETISLPPLPPDLAMAGPTAPGR